MRAPGTRGPHRRNFVRFGLFYQLPCADTQTQAARYNETIEQIIHADALGFDCAWLAELHFYKHFSIMSSPLIVATAIAQRTKRIRLGIAVNLLPLWHPVRNAEEGATVDLLSNGRLEFGVGRGTIPLHFAGFDRTRDDSRQRFEESLAIIKQAWTQETFSYDGTYYKIPETCVVPKPLQQPHPPIRVAANSPETAVFAGQTGYPIFVASVTNPLPKMFEQVATYRRAWDAHVAQNGGPAQPQYTEQDVSTMFFMRPGDSLDQVRGTVEPSIRNYFDSVLGMMTSGTGWQEDTESYRYTQELRSNLERITFEQVVNSMAVFGSSQECVERIRGLHAELHMDELICWFNPGGLVPHDQVKSAMTRFAAEVMPELKEL